MKNHRELRFGDHFIKRIGGFVVGVKLLQRRMQLEAANAASGDQTPRFLHGIRAAHWIDAREGHHDIAVVGRERSDVIV